MIKQRIVTGALLIFAMVAITLFLTPLAFASFSAAVVALASWEYSKLIGLYKIKQRNFYVIFIMVCLALARYVLVEIVLSLALVWWIYLFYRLRKYEKDRAPLSFELRVASGPFVLVPCWVALVDLRLEPGGGRMLLFLFVLIWLADIAAYFIGIRYGKQKLAESISPNKTYEGVYAALASSVVMGISGVLFFRQENKYFWPLVIVLVMLTVIFSVVGDLFESLLKRQQGLKDSGVILPGHGGVLDRIDSLTAAAPLFVLGVHLLGITR